MVKHIKPHDLVNVNKRINRNHFNRKFFFHSLTLWSRLESLNPRASTSILLTNYFIWLNNEIIMQLMCLSSIHHNDSNSYITCRSPTHDFKRARTEKKINDFQFHFKLEAFFYSVACIPSRISFGSTCNSSHTRLYHPPHVKL